MTEQDRAAERHLGLVHALCKRFTGRGVEYEELYAAGCLGLAKALRGFDEGRGLQFSTYAFPVIAGEIKRLFRDGGMIRVSRSLRELSMKIARLNEENGAELTVTQLAERLHTTKEKIAEAIGSTQAPLSLTAANDDGEPQLDVPSPDIQEAVTDRLSLQAAIRSLSDSDQRLLQLRYFQDKTQSETAKALHTSQVQISRREKRILANIREKMTLC